MNQIFKYTCDLVNNLCRDLIVNIGQPPYMHMTRNYATTIWLVRVESKYSMSLETVD